MTTTRLAASIPLLAMAALCPVPARAAPPYTASWASVDTHLPAPEWFKDVKFGVYFHFGVFSVPAYGNEWYPRRMYDTTDAVYTHHMNAYGDPFSNWPENDFIDGANAKNGTFTQFKPVLLSAGGHLDPDGMATLIANSGARFAGPVMEHHDGYSMWDSKANPWNSVDHGPKLNLAKLWTDAFRKKGLKILAAMHHAYHFTGYYEFVPAQTDPKLKILFAQQGTTVENQLWYDKLKEVIDEFQPDILWQDFNLRAVAQTQLLNFLSYYYNQAASWNKEVVATYKDGLDDKGEVYDYERGGPADLTTPYWLTDDAVSSKSWCYTSGMTYYSSTAILHSFFDRVSKGGNLLLNISPMADGSVPAEQVAILNAMGDWLGKFGEAIYATRTFSVYGEGPTKMGGGTSFTSPKAGTAQDIRYTTSKDGDAVYAIILGWPGNGKQVTLASVTTSSFKLGASAKVFLFGETPGAATSLTFSQTASGLTIALPAVTPYSALAYALKITQSGKQPGPPPPPPDTGSTQPPGGDGGVAPTPDAGGSSGGSGPPTTGSGGSTGAAGTGAAGNGASGIGGNSLAGATGSAGSGSSSAGSGGSGGVGVAGVSGTSGGAAGSRSATGIGGTGTGIAGTGGTGAAPPPAQTGVSTAGGCSCTFEGGDRPFETWAPLWCSLLAILVRTTRRNRSSRDATRPPHAAPP